MARKDQAVNQGAGRPRKLFSRDIEKDRKISKYHLDTAAEEQPDKIGYWLKLDPPAKKIVETLELDLSILVGEKSIYYRNTLDGGLDSKGNKKFPTEGSITSSVNMDEAVIAIKRDLIEKTEYSRLIQNAIKTMENVRTSIKVLDSLDSRDYFEKSGYAADQFESRVKQKEEKDLGKAQIKAGLQNVHIPDSDEEEVVTDIPEDVSEETVEPEVPEEFAPVEEPEAQEEPSDNADEPEETEVEETEVQEEAADNPCPSHYKFGSDFGIDENCDECDCESDCFRASKELAKK